MRRSAIFELHRPSDLVVLPLVIALSLAFGGAAAGSSRAVYVGYPGPARPAEEVATLRLVEADWVRFDTTLVERKDHQDIQMLPGIHRLEWGGTMGFLNPEYSRADSVVLEASHVYALHTDRQKIFGGGFRQFLWIEDLTTSAIVAGGAKPSRLTVRQKRLQWFKSDQQAEFFEAAESGDTATVRTFLERGFDVNSRDRRDRTALMMAADPGHAEMIDLLLDHGADVHAALEPPYGSTALMVAAAAGSEIAVGRLLAHPDTGVNARGTTGQTALMHAASANADEIIRLLLEHGAEINAKDLFDKTALDWARGKEAKSALQNAGGKRGKDL